MFYLWLIRANCNASPVDYGWQNINDKFELKWDEDSVIQELEVRKGCGCKGGCDGSAAGCKNCFSINPVFQSVNANCCAKTLTIMGPNTSSVLQNSQHKMIPKQSILILTAVTIKVVGTRVGVMVVQLDTRTVSDCVNPVFQIVDANCCAKTLTIMGQMLRVLQKSQHNILSLS